MPRGLTPLAELADIADSFVDQADLGPIDWTGPGPELAVDLHGNGPASKGPLLELEPGRLVAFAGPASDGLPITGPVWRDDEHEVDRWLRLIEEGLQIPGDPTDLLLEPPRVDTPAPPGAVVIHPGAASGARRWPAHRFAAVAAWASRFGPVVITGSEHEQTLADDVRRGAALPHEVNLAGRTDPLELAAVVAGARLVVSNDTGLAHLASAYQRPSVVLFGPTPPALWGPPTTGPHVALWRGAPGETRKGDPHADDPDPRLLAITVADVLEAAVRLLPEG